MKDISEVCGESSKGSSSRSEIGLRARKGNWPGLSLCLRAGQGEESHVAEACVRKLTRFGLP